MRSLWITGSTRSGKTTRLVREFEDWVRQRLAAQTHSLSFTPTVLVLAANNDNRRRLADQMVAATRGRYPVMAKTPLGFISEEVMLFWPLLFERLNLKAQFPLRLRPETEQELATRLWHDQWQADEIPTASVEYRLVRCTLDLLQLAGASCTPVEDIPYLLAQGFAGQGWERSVLPNVVLKADNALLWERMGHLLLQWRTWCLERGLLTYGIIYELYWRELLGDPTYQHHLHRRYQAVFADDVDDYPAIAHELCSFLLDQGAMGVFTYNPDSQVRLGLNADPQYWQGMAGRCRIESLEPPFPAGNQQLRPRDLKTEVVGLATDPVFIERLPSAMQSLQTTSRSAMLRQTAQVIIAAVEQGEIQPEQIAIIAPGLDEIARYTLMQILTGQGVPVVPLNEQRPLISSPWVRALLTLLALVYPGLGRLVDRDAIAEMLVMLSQQEAAQTPAIDPVRAGLIADHCYYPDPDRPSLLPIESFPRWDRLGHRAAKGYQQIAEWIEDARSRQQQHVLPNVVAFVDGAIKQFMGNGSNLPYDQLAALRELSETTQHYWEVERRLRQNEPPATSPTYVIAQFIHLLRRGTITANPYPLRPFEHQPQGAVTLATIFQYRASRQCHRWHFWLDASSPLWLKGGAANLFGANVFLKNWSGRAFSPEDQEAEDQHRLQRILRDLLARAQERVYLCHSDLAVNGTEQNGPLLTLVHASLALKLPLSA